VSKRRSWTIMLVPDEGSGPRQVRLGPGAVRVLLVTGLVVLVLVGLGVGTYWRVARTALKAVALQDENTRLQTEVQKVWELERLMADMLETDYKLRTRLGIPLPEDWPGYRFQLAPAPDQDTAGGAAGPILPGGRIGQRAGPEAGNQTVLFAWPVSPGFPTMEFGEGAGSAGMPHTGLDIAARLNTPVRAAADGLVTSAGMDERYGFLVEISHGGGLVTRYGHNARLVVGPGQMVKKGDIIAYVGSTGRVTTGPHLHFEVQKDGVPVNPRRYLPKY
jgi:murein DD-endopeptidase MepM/ murein hydrolase activator NlpD